MAQNLSFSNYGATPNPKPNFSPSSYQSVGGSPQAKALNSALANSIVVPQNLPKTPATNYQPPAPNAGNAFGSSFTTPGVIAPPAPSTPLKKTTQSNVDGSSITHEYHAPVAPETAPSAPQTPSNGPGGTAVVKDGLMQNPFPSTVKGLVDTSSQGSPQVTQNVNDLATTAKGNEDLGQAANKITEKYAGMINPILRGTIGQEVGDRTTGTAPVGEGNAAVAAQAGGALIQGLTNQEGQELAGTGQALTGQNQEAAAQNEAAGQANTAQATKQSGLSSAGTLTYPLTLGLGQYLSSPTGEELGGGTGAAYRNATNYGIANSNISSASDWAQSAQQVSTILGTVKNLSPQIQDFMSKNGINAQNAPVWNTPIQKYLQSVGNPGALTSFNAYMSELRGYAGQLLQTKGLTPSGAEGQVLSQDPSALNGAQLATYLQTLNNLGNTQLGVMQQNAKEAAGSNTAPGGPQIYSGTPAEAPTATPVATPNQGASAPTPVQVLFGSGMSAINGLLGNGGSTALSGAFGGLAEHLFTSLF